jgi:prolyl oligopeptidase
MRFYTLLMAAFTLATAPAAYAAENDPNLWLEEVEGVRALDQVRAWNAATEKRLQTESPAFKALQAEMQAILEDDSRIAVPEAILGDKVTNLWTGAKNPQGLWRIADLDAFAAGKPVWRTLIDLDAMSKADGRKWVWKGAACLAPAYARCMVGLSDGGSDALVYREFDMDAGAFVSGGFETPEAKGDVAWVDLDRLMIATAHGGDVTESGYPRQVRLWKRGTPMAEATLLAEGKASDMGMDASATGSEGRMWPRITRHPDFWTAETFHLNLDGTLIRSPLPDTATIEDMLGSRVVALLHKDWVYGGKTYAAGALVAYDAATLVVGGPAAVEQVYAPSGKQAIESVVAGSGRLYVSLLEDVAGRLIALTPTAAGWTAETVPVPPNSAVTLAVAGGANDTAFYTTESFASPETLMAVRGGSAPAEVAALRAFFDPASISVEQRFATSKDGTRIPYFVVRPAGAKGPLATIMHAYGGFRSAQKPTYLTKNPYQIGPGGLFWLKDGGSFVIANIRGGGEYGPAWHEAALREKRQNSFDDLYAVAEDLKRAGLTSKLGVSGRSQGGMLVGVAMTQRPDLFDAVIMGVPLADMLRYNRLLAGASWMGEYGNPDVAEDRAFIAKYSPYQNLRAGAKYPPVIIYTSTKDDRVHPGHARKYAARLAEQRHAFDYFENIEGGHTGTANAAEHAYRAALMLSFARRELMGK